MTQDKKAPARKVSREMMSAETWLRNHDEQTQCVVDAVTERRDQRRANYVKSLPADVRRGLVACGVIEADEAHEPSFHGDGRVD